MAADSELPTPLKREKKFSSFRTASKKNEGPSPTVSPVKRSDGLPEYRDTSTCGAPPSKTGIPENLSTRRLGAIATGPGGLLRHYASRVNDGSWKWHSKTETSTTATESSSGSHTTSGADKSTWASRAACLVLCLVSVALLSFFVFYAIADAVFTRRRSLGEKFDPATVQPPDDGVARV
ncbi:hypothetical protein MTO96_044544 [Rhipicephalus appendiculatus]